MCPYIKGENNIFEGLGEISLLDLRMVRRRAFIYPNRNCIQTQELQIGNCLCVAVSNMSGLKQTL